MEPTGLDLFAQPYHDSGPVCVPQPPRERGELVRVRVWVPDAYGAQSVTLRQTLDGEPRVLPCTPGQADGGGQWFEADVLAHNPVTRYRFLIVGGPASRVPYAWLTAAGLVPGDVSDSRDFTLVTYERAPQWVESAVVYQIFPDRFARSSAAVPITGVENLPAWAHPMEWNEPCSSVGPDNGAQLYGGNLAGIEERLDYLQLLGVNTLYLCPVFPAGSAHRYDASSFDAVDPLLGGNEALASLSSALHERGMRLILDLTTNHTGNTHEWFKAAQPDPLSEEAGYYFFSHHPAEYVTWLGVPSLPKLNHANPKLRRRMYDGPDSVTARWLRAPFDADGWRIDVANMTGRYGEQDLTHKVARTVRASLGPDRWLVAEHFHDASRDLDGDGWHGAMNYTGFTKPLWAWLSDPHNSIDWLGLPTSVPHLDTDATLTTLRDYGAQLTWQARLQSQNQLCSHDTARIRTVVGTAARHATAVAALVTFTGVPTLFAGDELALEGLNGEHSRTPMPWDAIDSGTLNENARTFYALTASALRLRETEPALRTGGLRWVHAGPESLTLMRTHPEFPVLVHLARDAGAIVVPMRSQQVSAV